MTSEDVDAYPLAWPVGWPRAKYRERAKFGAVSVRKVGESTSKHFRALTMAEGRDRLLQELERLGADQAVISTNVKPRLDGQLRGDASNPADPGAAVYFRLKGEPRVLATDKWDRLADNLAAIAAHIEALRSIERHGVGSLAQAFAGYKALAAVGEKKPWWQVLGFKESPVGTVYASQVEAKWQELMRQHHPDRGGNANQAAEINAAWDEARKEFGI